MAAQYLPWFKGGAFVLTVSLTAALLALTEIQIEGPNGWAEKLPTWRISNRWTRLFMSGKPLTGYHLYLNCFVLAVLHIPFGLSLVPWSIKTESIVVSFLILLWTAEDFLWFVLNPAFRIRRFKREHIWWHAPAWWWIMPRDYWLGSLAGVVLYVYGSGAL